MSWFYSVRSLRVGPHGLQLTKVDKTTGKILVVPFYTRRIEFCILLLHNSWGPSGWPGIRKL